MGEAGELPTGRGDVLLLSLRGRVRYGFTGGGERVLEAQYYAWLVSGRPLRLAAEATKQTADLLVWRFATETLPAAMQEWLP